MEVAAVTNTLAYSSLAFTLGINQAWARLKILPSPLLFTEQGGDNFFLSSIYVSFRSGLIFSIQGRLPD
jgi:hypothetical protein